MTIDFQAEPFFDDYSEDKQFYKILFRPGYAVQARELNQLQTILSEQIKRHGDHMFKDGAMIIPGQISYDLDVSYIRLDDSTGINYDSALEIINGKVIKNNLPSPVLARVIAVSKKEGNDSTTIFVRYLASGTDNLGNSVPEFTSNDVLSLLDGSSLPITVKVADQDLLTSLVTDKGSIASIQRGVYYAKGKFVLVPEQTIILDKYGNTPSYRIGLQLNESVIYPEDDETLLDNALGSPNYAAPGAARHYIDLTLSKIPLDSSTDSDFVDLLRLRNGKVLFKVTRTEYAELEKTLARRTSDESGDYALNPFIIKTREYRSNYRGPRGNRIRYIQGDVIRVPRQGSINLFDYFVCINDGESNSTNINFPSDPTITNYYQDIQDGTVVWEATNSPVFNNGVNQFFSDDSRFADFTVEDHKRLASMTIYEIAPNKAYVKGYEIEKIATEYLPSFKSRDIPAGSSALAEYLGEDSLPEITSSVSTKQTTRIDLSFGSYALAKELKYAPDIINFTKVDLYNEVYTSPSKQKIGTARVRAIELHDKVPTVLTGTWAVTDTTATITSTAHGLSGGNLIYLNFTSGTSPADGYYTVVSSTADSFTITVTGGSYTSGDCAFTNESSAKQDQYKVFLFDIDMIGDNKFSQVKSIYGSSKFTCNFITQNDITILNEANKSSLIYSIPDYAVKSVDKIIHTLTYSRQSVALPNTSIAIGNISGFSYASPTKQGNYYVIDSSGNYLNATITLPTSTTLSVTEIPSGNYTLISTIESTGTSTSSFTKLKEITTTLNVTKSDNTRVYNLAHGNATRIESIKMKASSGATNYTVDITNRFVLGSNQYESHYANSTIRVLDSEALPSQDFQVIYEYIGPLNSDSPENLFAVPSYIHDDSNIRYEDIPVNGRYSLIESLDFRPYVNDSTGNTYAQRLLPKYGTTALIEYTKYLPRTDNLCLTDKGQYLVSYGIPNVNPLEPSIPSNAMKIAIIDVEPYTFNTNLGLKVTRIDNKRYTMRDIGKLENRIKDLEYYTSLSILESETNSLQVTDSSGLDRFQSGFLVDSFSGQGIGNVSSEEWNASIDQKNRELRPFFSQRQVNMLEVVNSGGSYQYKVNGDIITIPRASTPEVPMISQLRASTAISVNPFDVATFRGLMYLNPWSDTWFATDRRPDIIINDDGQYNAVVAKAEADGVLGTFWNAWQILFQGEPVTTGSRLDVISSAAQGNRFANIDTEILNANNGFGGAGTLWRARTSFTTEELNAIGITDGRLRGAFSNSVAGSRVITIETDAVEIGMSRTGSRTFIQDKVDSRVVDDKVVETQVIPYIRPRAVLFNAKGLKRTTDVNAFFDGINVNKYIEKAKVIEVLPITGLGYTFDTDRNCGTNVSQEVRKIEMPSYGVGTITVTHGSTTVTGVSTSFISEFCPDPNNVSSYVTNTAKIIIGDEEYTVTSVTDNDELTLKTAYTSPTGSGTFSGIAYKIKLQGIKNTEVEIAFTHGEVIRGQTSNATAIVVGQEIQRIDNSGGARYYIHVLNIKGDFSPNEILVGEYTDTEGNNGIKPQVKFLALDSAQNTKLESGKVKTSYTGQLHGLFKIPNNPIDRFKTGVRELTFTDQDTSATQGGTEARAYYEANGLLEIKQRTIVSTRTAQLAIEQLNPEENRIIQTTDRLVRDTGWFDPLAQTFLVQEEGGAFLSSIDLFFFDIDENIPVRIEIREVVNGYPGQKVLPFSRVQKFPSEVFTSADGSVATKFRFVSPVYVQEYTEYAVVILSDSARYFVHISRSGALDYNQNKISGQPYNGVFFTSQNASTWTASQEEDLKFVLNKAQFQTGSYRVKLATPKLSTKNLDFDPFYFKQGSSKMRVFHRNHGFKDGDSVTFTTRSAITGIDVWTYAEIFDKPHTVQTVEEDAYVIDLETPSKTALITGRSGGAFVYATENYEYSTAMLNASNITVAGTDIKYQLTVTNKSSPTQKEVVDIINGENHNFNSAKILRYEDNVNDVPEDVILEAIMSTSNPNLSPTLDTGRIALTMVNNKVDNPSPHTINDEDLDAIELVIDGALVTNTAVGNQIQVLAKEIKIPQGYLTAYNNFSQLRIGSTVKFSGSKHFFVQEKYNEGTTNLVIKFADLVSNNGSEIIEDINLLTDSTVMNSSSTSTRTVEWISHYNSEISPSSGSVTSKYVTKKINLARSSDMLRIMFSALIPNEADIEVYYKVGQSTDSELIDRSYFRAAPTTPYVKSDIKFTNLQFDVENLESFTSVVVKLVMRSTDTAKVPRIKNFRVIACAA